MKNLKKSVLLFSLLSIAFTFTATPKANASFIIGGITNKKIKFPFMWVGFGTTLAALSIEGIKHRDIESGLPFDNVMLDVAFSGLGLVVLDADGSLGVQQLEESFLKQFDFINDTQIGVRFANATKAKYAAALKADPEATAVRIGFNDEEVASILAGVKNSVTPEQMQTVVTALKI